jgi:electron transfer flavoprotein beta subunit
VDVLVCIKRVPGASSSVVLTDDGQSVDTRHVGWTIGPHEECAIEAAVQVAAATGGVATVLTLGPADAIDQLREALAVGVTKAVHVVADNEGWGPGDVAAAIADVARAAAAAGNPYGLLLFGNDAADTGDFQVGVRVAYALGLPVVTGARTLAVEGSDGAQTLAATGDGPDGVEFYELPVPAVVTVKEGGIDPRYPSIPGRLKAKKAPVEVVEPALVPAGSGRVRLTLPPEQPSQVEILGHGAQAAAAVVDLLTRIGVVTA